MEGQRRTWGRAGRHWCLSALAARGRMMWPSLPFCAPPLLVSADFPLQPTDSGCRAPCRLHSCNFLQNTKSPRRLAAEGANRENMCLWSGATLVCSLPPLILDILNVWWGRTKCSLGYRWLFSLAEHLKCRYVEVHEFGPQTIVFG
jgi:hypothetical protein